MVLRQLLLGTAVLWELSFVLWLCEHEDVALEADRRLAVRLQQQRRLRPLSAVMHRSTCCNAEQ
jgi:hypothetical protein